MYDTQGMELTRLTKHNKKPVRALTQEASSRSDMSSQYEVINYPQKIISVLNTIHQKHEFLTIDVKDGMAKFTSLLLEVNEAENYIVLDQFFPPPDYRFQFDQQFIEISTKYRGIELRFITRLEAVSDSDKYGEYYKASIPDRLFYHQRRKYKRVPVATTQGNKVYISTDNRLLTHGHLLNISQGGFQASLISSPNDEFDRGLEISKCLINLNTSDKIYGPVEITHTSEPYRGRMRLACKFLDLNVREERIIDKLVAQQDRQNIRLLKAS